MFLVKVIKIELDNNFKLCYNVIKLMTARNKFYGGKQNESKKCSKKY